VSGPSPFTALVTSTLVHRLATTGPELPRSAPTPGDRANVIVRSSHDCGVTSLTTTPYSLDESGYSDRVACSTCPDTPRRSNRRKARSVLSLASTTRTTGCTPKLSSGSAELT
jgi:hypothetical protein